MSKLSKILTATTVLCFLGVIFYAFYPKLTETTKNGITYEIQGLFDQKYKVTDCNSSSGESITIPSKIKGKPVAEIADNAFAKCDWITSITLPNSIKRIGKKAFSKCTALETLELNEGIKKIDEKAFEYCSNLKSLTLPSTLKEIALDGKIVQECIALPSGQSGYYDRGGEWLIKYVYFNGTEEEWDHVYKAIKPEETFTSGPFDGCDGVAVEGTPEKFPDFVYYSLTGYNMGKLVGYYSCSLILNIKCLK